MVLQITDTQYPSQLAKIPDPPVALHIEGSSSAPLNEICLGIVGTRNITTYGLNVINKLLGELSFYRCTIVSGFSRGVDVAVHEKCLTYSIPTISIVPFGLSYGKKHVYSELIDKITRNHGLVISEYEDTFEPKKWSFVRRNRLIAGISEAILVIEAAEKSGSLITAKYAHDYNKPVYIIPGSIFSPYSTGIYELLFSYAQAIISGHQLAKLLKLPIRECYPSKVTSAAGSADLDPLDLSIINVLKAASLNAEEIAQYVNRDSNIILKRLMYLSGARLVGLCQGRYYAL